MVPSLIMWAAATVAACWKVSQLVRVPRDTGLRVVTACTVLVFLALSAQLVVTVPGWSEAFPSQTPKLLQNVLLTVFFALLLVLLHSNISPKKVGTRGWGEIALALSASAGMTVAFVFTPAAVQGASYGDAGEHPAVVVFYLVGNLYMAYATARGSWLSWVSAAHTRSHARLGLRVAAVGLAVCCLGTHVPRVLATSGMLALGEALIPATAVWTPPLLAAGIVTFFLGIGFPGARTGLIKLRLWFEVRRDYRDLRPLWQALYEQFPHIALVAPDKPWREALKLRNMRLRYYRRVIECRDGLVCLSPYVDQADLSGADPSEQAQLVQQALVNVSRQAQTSSGAVLAAPESAGIEADTEELLALSRELSRQQSTSVVPVG